jgi:type IV pilus assembly protein PilA
MIKRIAKGFTLIELMIVVAIIGILAAIAIPNFVKFQCRSKQSEAKTNLKAIYVAQESYRGEFDSYVAVTAANYRPGGANSLGFYAQGQRRRYDYSSASTATTFLATAAGITPDTNNDEWTITEANDLTNTSNNCD